MNICTECGREWPDAAKFCPFDGATLGGGAANESAESSSAIADMMVQLSDDAGEPDREEASSDAVVSETAADERPVEAVESMPAPEAAESSEEEDDLDKFSETSWFMAGSSLDELDSDQEKVQIDEAKYRPDQNLEDEIRRKFSLRDDIDTDA